VRPDLVDRDDVGVRQAGRGARLAREAARPGGIVGGAQNLHGDGAAERVVAGLADHAGAAGADGAHDHELADPAPTLAGPMPAPMFEIMSHTKIWVLAAALCGLLTGCVAAAAAGAGAGAGYYFTSRGVGSQIAAPVDDVAAQARNALADEGIAVTDFSSSDSGDTRTLAGKKGELEVKVELSRSGEGTTQAEVTARKNLLEWDKGYAQQVLDRIVSGTQSAKR
jgi:hypothetical protein